LGGEGKKTGRVEIGKREESTNTIINKKMRAVLLGENAVSKTITGKKKKKQENSQGKEKLSEGDLGDLSRSRKRNGVKGP